MNYKLIAALFFLSSACTPAAPPVRVFTVSALAGSGTLAFARTQAAGEAPGGTIAIDAAAGACPTLAGDARVTVDGRAASLSPGGAGRPVMTGPLEIDGTCDPPTFRAPADLAASPTTHLEIADATGTIELTVTAFTATRALAFASSGAATLRRGETAAVAWSPASDGVDLTSTDLEWFVDGRAFPQSDFGGGAALAVQGGAFSFTVAADAQSGGGHLALSGADFKPALVECAGVLACKVDVFAPELDLSALVAP